MRIYLTAILKAKPEFLAEVKTLLQDMVLQTRKETACIQYDLHQDVEDESNFVFYEIWKDQKGLDLHNQQHYIKDFVALVPEKLLGTPIIVKMEKI